MNKIVGWETFFYYLFKFRKFYNLLILRTSPHIPSCGHSLAIPP
nr:MAG TPA: hypothetical protein [Caudoviricetes sp.]